MRCLSGLPGYYELYFSTLLTFLPNYPYLVQGAYASVGSRSLNPLPKTSYTKATLPLNLGKNADYIKQVPPWLLQARLYRLLSAAGHTFLY